MPLRDESKYNIIVPGEPKEVTEIRKKILSSFDGLEFVDEEHKYFLNGEELSSVSSIVSQFEEEFDTQAKAEAYALKNGETPEYWIDKWKFINLKATVSGTQVHSYGESLSWLYLGHPENITEDNKYKYIADKNWLIPTRPKENAALSFFENFPENTYIVLPETRIYNIGDRFKYAGTFDLLVYYDHPTDKSKSGLVVMDWKTNREIYKEFSREHGKMMVWPFSDLFDEPYGGYVLQINFYSLALEKIGLKVIGKRIIWLKDDETYEIIPAPDISQNIRKLDNNV
jgi:hypothetical protein